MAILFSKKKARHYLFWVYALLTGSKYLGF